MKKKSAWLAFLFLATACFITEQMTAVLLGNSGLLLKIYFAVASVGIPGICLAAGHEEREKEDFKRVVTLLYLFAFMTVLEVLFEALLGTVSIRKLPENELLMLCAALCLFELIRVLTRSLPKAVSPVLSLLFGAGAVLIGGSVLLHDLLLGACFYFLGLTLRRYGIRAGEKLSGTPAVLISAAIGILYGAAVLFFYPTVSRLGSFFAPEYYGGKCSPLTALAALAVTVVVVFAMLSFGNAIDYLASGMGSRYRTALISALAGVFLLRQGWVMAVVMSMSLSHWTVFAGIFIVFWVFLSMSDSMNVFCEFFLWPVGEYRGKGFRLTRIFKNIKKYRFLLRELIKKGIVLKYRRSFFGILWSLFEPLLTMMVLTFVFSNFFGKNDPFYPIYILTGRLLFSMFQTTTGQALKSVRGNASMIKKVYVPKYMYPLSTVLFNFVLFLISLIDLVAMMLFYHVPFTLHLLESLIPIAVLLVFAIGVGLILATVNVFFRDIEYLWNVFMLLLMYCSAIFYRTSGLGSDKQWLFKVNPIYLLIYNFRLTITGPDSGPLKNVATHLDMATMIPATIMAFASLVIGIVVFYRKQDEFILHI